MNRIFQFSACECDCHWNSEDMSDWCSQLVVAWYTYKVLTLHGTTIGENRANKNENKKKIISS